MQALLCKLLDLSYSKKSIPHLFPILCQCLFSLSFVKYLLIVPPPPRKETIRKKCKMQNWSEKLFLSHHSRMYKKAIKHIMKKSFEKCKWVSLPPTDNKVKPGAQQSFKCILKQVKATTLRRILRVRWQQELLLTRHTHLRDARKEGLDVNIGVVHLQVMISQPAGHSDCRHDTSLCVPTHIDTSTHIQEKQTHT